MMLSHNVYSSISKTLCFSHDSTLKAMESIDVRVVTFSPTREAFAFVLTPENLHTGNFNT